MAQETYYGFSVGDTRFIAMNAFDVPDPKSFSVLPQPMEWLGHQLDKASIRKQTNVLLLHCYPSDLKVGDKELGNSCAITVCG
jgi:Icc protein